MVQPLSKTLRDGNHLPEPCIPGLPTAAARPVLYVSNNNNNNNNANICIARLKTKFLRCAQNVVSVSSGSVLPEIWLPPMQCWLATCLQAFL